MSDAESFVSACASSQNIEEARASPAMLTEPEEDYDAVHQTAIRQLSAENEHSESESLSSRGSDGVPIASSSRTIEAEDAKPSPHGEEVEILSESPEEVKVREIISLFVLRM
jgi:hypothetical protein